MPDYELDSQEWQEIVRPREADPMTKEDWLDLVAKESKLNLPEMYGDREYTSAVNLRVPKEQLIRRHPSSERFHELLQEMGDLHDKKQKDYGRANDPFANVRGSQEWGIQPWVGAMIRANDKVKRLQQFALTGELANESARDSFIDLAVYAIIALVIYEESVE